MTSGDERNENLSLDFDKLYNDVASIRLHSAVPEKVQSYFASIQNLCLYGWYVYSFYALTEFLTYTCIEMALREKFKREDPKRAWSFKKLLGKSCATKSAARRSVLLHFTNSQRFHSSRHS